MSWILCRNKDGIAGAKLVPNSFAVVVSVGVPDAGWLVGDIVYRDTRVDGDGGIHNLRDDSYADLDSTTERYTVLDEPFTLTPTD